MMRSCAVAVVACVVAIAPAHAGESAAVAGGSFGSAAEALLSPDPVVAAAGDIACDPASIHFNHGLGTSSRCRQKAVSDLLINSGLTAVLPLGDNQYECGGAGPYLQSYDPSWGRVKAISRPIPGDNDYAASGGSDCDTSGKAGGYYGYFGAAAGDRTKGYYSFELGAWHVVALNSNCSKVGGCSAGSPQEKWLRADLAAHPTSCTLAYAHHPRFSSTSGTESKVRPLWDALHAAGAEIMLSGNQHNYERFAPQTPAGAADPAGVRQFVVGTGGKSLFAFGTTVLANSEARGKAFGVLRLTLRPTSYDWQFVPVSGATFTDAGSAPCHGGAPSGDTEPPTSPTNLSASAPASTRVELSWTAATDDVAVTAHQIFRGGALIATTGAGTTFTDDTVAPSTSYDYHVRARDAAGNLSPASNTATVTTPESAGLTTLAFAPEADARVEEIAPGSNFGGSYLSTEAGSDPDVETYLRFPVTGVTGSVRRAVLRLFAYNGTGNGPAVYGTGTAWSEDGITWSSRPPRATAPTDDKGAVATNSWVEFDVTPLVRGDGTYGFTLGNVSSDAMDIHSREAASLRPELVLTVE
jgi:acid phosphatase type 7